MSKSTDTNKSTLDERRRKAALLLEVEESRVETYSLQLARLRQLGALVEIEVRGLSMFQVAANWSDWGVGDEDERHDRLRLGSKVLIPRRMFNTLRSEEAMFRNDLNRYSFNVPGFRPFKLVPFTAYAEWRKKYDERLKRWNSLKRDILDRYDALLDLISKDFEAIADRSWRSFQAQGYTSLRIEGVEFTTRDQFVDYVVGKAQSRFPTRERIRKELVVDYRTAILDDSPLTGDEKPAKSERLSKKDLAEGEFAERLAAMRQAELEQARRRIEEMGSPLDSVFGELRGRIVEQVESILASIKQNGFLRGRAANTASGLLEFYDLMAVTSDSDLRAKLAELKDRVGEVGKARDRASDERDNKRIAETLKQIVNIAGREAEAMAKINPRFSNLEV